MTWLHIQRARTFAPEDLGASGVLCWGGRIVAVGPDLHPPVGADVETLDGTGRLLLPGLIDPHIHIMGTSGGDGPARRTPDLPISRITAAGVTAVVSPLGTDSLSRTIPGLLARAAAATAEGISAYAYTGGWRNPVPTLTGDPQTDVACLDRVLGVKVALAEPTVPPCSAEYLLQLAHAAILGGRLAGKRAVLHAHIGDRPEGLQPLWDAVRATGLPPDRFVATHVNRNPGLWRQALDFVRAGGSIDLTAQMRPDLGFPDALPPASAIPEALRAGVPPERITLSSDSGSAHLRPGGSGASYMAGPDTLLQTLKGLVREGLSWAQASAFASRNAADLLGLSRKGRIAEGADADLLLLTGDGEIDRVWCRGRLMVAGGDPVVRGYFE
jgi:beta-aspartyl-dipeptidase (metallo-type)